MLKLCFVQYIPQILFMIDGNRREVWKVEFQLVNDLVKSHLGLRYGDISH